jgi:hypothetical protein
LDVIHARGGGPGLERSRRAELAPQELQSGSRLDAAAVR